MKTIYETNYSFYKTGCKNVLNFVLLSDLHFSSCLKNEVLEKIIDYTEQKQPSYILFLGDLVHCLSEIDNEAQRKRLASFMERLSDIAPIIAIFGNHDFYRYDENKHHGWHISSPNIIVDIIKDNPRITFLRNESYEDDNIYVYGFAPDSEYYSYDSAHNHQKTTIFNPQKEDKNIFIHNLKQIPDKKIHGLKKHKINLFLCHSPVYLGDKHVLPFLSDFDATISGHMHNGVVPPALNDIWQSDRGIIAPGNTILPRRARNGALSYKDPNIILGAIQSIQPYHNFIGLLSHAFPIYAATLSFSEDITCQRHPRKKRRYL